MPEHAPCATNGPAATGDESPWLLALSDGLGVLADIRDGGFGPEAEASAETVLGLCHLLLFRLRTQNRFPLIGILGNADSGKSTLLASVAGREISRVTPIPHQTLGPILAVPRSFLPWCADPSFLRPVVDRVDSLPEETTGLSGSPERAVAVPAWGAERNPFLLMDLPDIGSVDAREERQVALRILPWLDRVILMVTEETFAQAEHEELAQNLARLRPPRARAEFFVVLNRRHGVTTDEEFARRLESIRRFHPDATVSWLPHLRDALLFPQAQTSPLVSESSPRVLRTLQEAVRNLAGDLSRLVLSTGEQRVAEQRLLRRSLQREIQETCRFSKAFFSDDFRRQLEIFSPWNPSVRRLRSLLKKEKRRSAAVVDLLAEAPVQRRAAETARRLAERVAARQASLPRPAGAPLPPPPAPPAEAIRSCVSALVSRTNEQARAEVEVLLASLQEDRRIKDPVWGLVAGVSSTLLLLELVVPGFGTLSSMTFSGLLSALGFGGILTSDMMRRIRSNRLREAFESGMRRILEDAADSLLASAGFPGDREVQDLARRLSAWVQRLPEV